MTPPETNPAPSPGAPVEAVDPAGVWQRIQTLLLTTENIDGFLTELAVLGAAVVGPAASCAITVRYDGRPITVASSDDRGSMLDETQYANQSGPCLQALDTGQTVHVPDATTETRWTAYSTRARTQGLKSSLSIPLPSSVLPGTVGAMNFYSFDQLGTFDLATQTACALFAAQAAGAIQLLSRSLRNTELVDQAEQALSSRTLVDQALGVLMATRSCTAAEAFEILRVRSQTENRKLRLIAADTITEITGHQPADTGTFRRPT